MLNSENVYFCPDFLTLAYKQGNTPDSSRIFCTIISTSIVKARQLCDRLSQSIAVSPYKSLVTFNKVHAELRPGAKHLPLYEIMTRRLIKGSYVDHYLACDTNRSFRSDQSIDYTQYFTEMVKPNSTLLKPLSESSTGPEFVMQRLKIAQAVRATANSQTTKSIAKAAQSVSKSIATTATQVPNITINNIVSCPLEDIKKTMAVGLQTYKCECNYDISNPLRTVIIAALLLTALVVVFSYLNNHTASSNTNAPGQRKR